MPVLELAFAGAGSLRSQKPATRSRVVRTVLQEAAGRGTEALVASAQLQGPKHGNEASGLSQLSSATSECNTSDPREIPRRTTESNHRIMKNNK